MRRWLPTLRSYGTTVCECDGEYEGIEIQLRWFGLHLALVFAQRERSVEAIDGD